MNNLRMKNNNIIKCVLGAVIAVLLLSCLVVGFVLNNREKKSIELCKSMTFDYTETDRTLGEIIQNNAEYNSNIECEWSFDKRTNAVACNITNDESDRVTLVFSIRNDGQEDYAHIDKITIKIDDVNSTYDASDALGQLFIIEFIGQLDSNTAYMY